MKNQELERKDESKKIDLVKIYKELSKKRYFILKSLILGLLVGVVIAVSVPKEYFATVKLVPVTVQRNDGQVMSVAALMGITNNAKEDMAIPKEYYPDIIQSVPFLLSFKDIVVTPKGLTDMSLYEYLVLHQKRAWWKSLLYLPQLLKGMFSDDPVKLDSVWDPFYLTASQKSFVEELKHRIVFEKTENKNILSIKISMQDPVVAARVGNYLLEELDKYITGHNRERIIKDLGFTERMYEELKSIYQDFAIKKKEINSDSRVQLDVDVALGMFNMMYQQYEILKLKANKEQIAFTVIEPATVPLYSANMNWFMVVGISMFLFGFIAVVWCLFSFAFIIDYRENGK